MPERSVLGLFIRDLGRPMMKGEPINGHTHNFWHVSSVCHGSVKAFERNPGEKNWRLHTASGSPDGIYAAHPKLGLFPKIKIAAELEHRFEALEDYTFVECWYPNRDFDGNMADSYVGNQAALV